MYINFWVSCVFPFFSSFLFLASICMWPSNGLFPTMRHVVHGGLVQYSRSWLLLLTVCTVHTHYYPLILYPFGP
jgi:hypothetical protein